MVKARRKASKRMTSSRRHKIDRKKRERHRDVRRAAKALKRSGAVPTRSKKMRNATRVALSISQHDPQKEEILKSLLQARENARVLRASKREQRIEDAAAAASEGQGESVNALPPPVASARRVVPTLIPPPLMDSWPYQIRVAIDDFAFPTPPSTGPPAITFLIVADARCVLQTIPWAVLDAIVAVATERAVRPVQCLVVVSKVDVVPANVIGTSVAMVDHALRTRYGAPPPSLRWDFAPFAVSFPVTHVYLAKVLKRYRASMPTNSATIRGMASNLRGTHVVFAVGLPRVGTSTVLRCLQQRIGEAMNQVPLRQVVLGGGKRPRADGEAQDDALRVCVPNARHTTVLTLPTLPYPQPEDVVAGGIFFCTPRQRARHATTVPAAIMIASCATDKVALQQAFNVAAGVGNGGDAVEAATAIVKAIGGSVRRYGGLYASALVSPLAATASRIASSHLAGSAAFNSVDGEVLLDTTLSHTTPMAFVRATDILAETQTAAPRPKAKGKGRTRKSQGAPQGSALGLGASILVESLASGRYVPWAVLSLPHDLPPFSEDNVTVHALQPPVGEDNTSLTTWTSALTAMLRPHLAVLPTSALEIAPHCIQAPSVDLNVAEDEPNVDYDDELDECDEEMDEELDDCDDELE